MEKERVDILVVQQGLTDSREKAKRLVMAGQIVDAVNHNRYDKPGEKIPVTSSLMIKGEPLKYVSRGGLKLEKGGFTDAALQNGAKQSYALDVGYNQLDYKLRQDERVVVMERMNFRFATPDDFTKGQPDVASIDVSFISLKLILPPLKPILKEGGDVLVLIKPQFEAGRERIGKKGIVSDPKVHEDVLVDILSFSEQIGFTVEKVTYSPITGGSGNIEFLAHLKNTAPSEVHSFEELARETVKEAQRLKK